MALYFALPPELYIVSGGEALAGGIMLLCGLFLRDGWLIFPAPALIISGGIDSLAVLTNNPSLWHFSWPLLISAIGIGVFMGTIIHQGPEKYIRFGSIWIGVGLLLFIGNTLFHLIPPI